MGATLAELEQCLDGLRDPAVQKVFFGKLQERRADLIANMIEDGKDEHRFKIQMINEIVGYEKEVLDDWRSQKEGN